jgi:hypothetical protein
MWVILEASPVRGQGGRAHLAAAKSTLQAALAAANTQPRSSSDDMRAFSSVARIEKIKAVANVTIRKPNK